MSEKKNRSFFHDDSYEKFRYFLKLNFYYCTLSKEQQAENINPISPTKYSYYKDIIEMIASGKIAFPKYNKKKAFKYVKCSPFVRQCGIIEIYPKEV